MADSTHWTELTRRQRDALVAVATVGRGTRWEAAQATSEWPGRQLNTTMLYKPLRTLVAAGLVEANGRYDETRYRLSTGGRDALTEHYEIVADAMSIEEAGYQ